MSSAGKRTGNVAGGDVEKSRRLMIGGEGTLDLELPYFSLSIFVSLFFFFFHFIFLSDFFSREKKTRLKKFKEKMEFGGFRF